MDQETIFVIAGSVAAVLAIPVMIWLHFRHGSANAGVPAKESKNRRVRSAAPAILVTGRADFVRQVEANATRVALTVGTQINEVKITEGDPGRNRRIRYVDTVELGKPNRVHIWTDSADMADPLWQCLPDYANRLANLEREYFQTGFFSKVVAVAVGTDPIGLTMSRMKKPFKVLIRTVPRTFHFSYVVARAAEDSPEMIEFLRRNFDMVVAPGQIARYLSLRVLHRVCPAAGPISVQSPKLLESMAPAIDAAFDSIRGSDVESDLLSQAAALAQLIRAGHVTMVGLEALGIDLRG